MTTSIVDQREALFAELRSLTALWNEHDLVPHSDAVRCRTIGHKLNELGGFELMREAFYSAKAANRAALVIQHYWNGIGKWRS